MKPSKVQRQHLRTWTDLPNIGPASARDLDLLGIQSIEVLGNLDPVDLFIQLCHKTSQIHDPCVLDVLISITRFVAGDEPKDWWAYTAERKVWMQKDPRLLLLKRTLA